MSENTIIVGAGLTGLALAHALRAARPDLIVLEEREEAGGNLRSRILDTPEGRWLLELGPGAFGDASSPLMDLVRAVGLEPRLQRAAASADRRLLWRAGRLREVPSSPGKFAMSSVLPPLARFRALQEMWVPARPPDFPEETLAAFCDRRFGPVLRQKLVTAVVGGIFAGDPERLGVESAFPKMAALEQEYGSLLRAARDGSGPPSRGTLASFPDGLQELSRALARKLGDSLRTGTPVVRIERSKQGWLVVTKAGERLIAREVFVTAPADRAAELIGGPFADVADELRTIHYAPVAVIHVGVRRDRGDTVPDAFGFLVPRDEGLRILGAIFSSRLFPGRAPEGHDLLTVFIGGDLDPHAPDLHDDTILGFVMADLRRALGSLPDPTYFRIVRWPRAIPQYHVGHRNRIERIDAALRAARGLHVLGNWRGGIAMPDCAREAAETAARVTQS